MGVAFSITYIILFSSIFVNVTTAMKDDNKKELFEIIYLNKQEEFGIGYRVYQYQL